MRSVTVYELVRCAEMPKSSYPVKYVRTYKNKVSKLKHVVQ
jgi:hypothetical protein